MVGISMLFVPISLLQSLSVVQFSGGRGLLFLTDLDTLFLDVTIAAGLVLVYRRWTRARRQLPFLCFLLVLGTVTGGLLAYVVTNFGALFRLRLLMAVPLWMLALAAHGRPEATRDEYNSR